MCSTGSCSHYGLDRFGCCVHVLWQHQLANWLPCLDGSPKSSVLLLHLLLLHTALSFSLFPSLSAFDGHVTSSILIIYPCSMLSRSVWSSSCDTSDVHLKMWRLPRLQSSLRSVRPVHKSFEKSKNHIKMSETKRARKKCMLGSWQSVQLGFLFDSKYISI